MAAATDQDKEHASSITITYLIQVTQAYINIAQDMITQDTILRHRTGEMTVRGYWYI